MCACITSLSAPPGFMDPHASRPNQKDAGSRSVGRVKFYLTRTPAPRHALPSPRAHRAPRSPGSRRCRSRRDRHGGRRRHASERGQTSIDAVARSHMAIRPHGRPPRRGSQPRTRRSRRREDRSARRHPPWIGHRCTPDSEPGSAVPLFRRPRLARRAPRRWCALLPAGPGSSPRTPAHPRSRSSGRSARASLRRHGARWIRRPPLMPGPSRAGRAARWCPSRGRPCVSAPSRKTPCSVKVSVVPSPAGANSTVVTDTEMTVPSASIV